MPFIFLFGPCMWWISWRLNLRVPPTNFPTDGVPTPRSRFFGSLRFEDDVGLSRIMPFSRASRRRISSLVVAFAEIPFLWDIGMLFCVYIEVLAPTSCARISSARCRFEPVGVRSDAESRRCDSLSKRCNAKSCLRLAASVVSLLSSSAVLLFGLRCLIECEDGGLAPC